MERRSRNTLIIIIKRFCLTGCENLLPVSGFTVNSLEINFLTSLQINTVDTEVMNAKAKFEAMRDTVKARFHDLQKLLDAQEKNCYKSIQEREDAFFRVRSSYRAELEEYRGSVSAHNSTVEQLVVSAPDGALLAMATKLKTRLDSLEQQATGGGEDKTRGQAVIGDIVFDQQIQVQITEKVNTFGRLTDRAEQEMQGKMVSGFCIISEEIWLLVMWDEE